jgi:hypothetical protein
MDIGSVLSRSWQIIWKHKVLWIFGILAGCTNGGGGGGSSWRSGGGGNGGGQVPPQFEPFVRPFQNLTDGQIALLVAIGFLVALVLIVIAVFLGTIGRVGLIRGTQQAEAGTASLVFGELFSGSMPYFWRVFGLGLLVGLLALIVGGGIAVLAVLGTVATLGLGLICLIPLICILVPIFWFISVIVEQASIAIVLENLGVMDGLRRGWEVVRLNLGTMIVMALILVLGVGGIGGLIIGLPVVFIVLPAVLSTAFSQVPSDNAISGGWILAAVCFIAYLPVLLVLNGILRSYIETAWTLTFMRLTGKPAAALQPTSETM